MIGVSKGDRFMRALRYGSIDVSGFESGWFVWGGAYSHLRCLLRQGYGAQESYGAQAG